MKSTTVTGQLQKLRMRMSGIKITHRLTGLLAMLLVGFVIIGVAYYQVQVTETEAQDLSNKMIQFEKGVHDVQTDLLEARQNEVEFYLKKYPIYLGKFDTRMIVASQNLNEITSLVKDEKELSVVTRLGDTFEIYRNRFIQAAEAQIDIGLNANLGLHYELLELNSELTRITAPVKSALLNATIIKLNSLIKETLLLENASLSATLTGEIKKAKNIVNGLRLPVKTRSTLNKLLIKYQNTYHALTNKLQILTKARSDVKQAVKKIEPLFELLINKSKNIIATAKETSTQRKANITSLFVATLLVIAAAVTIALFLLARSITNPLRKLHDTVVKVNSGDISARVNSTSRDELGTLADAFDLLLDEKVASLAEAEKESELLNDSVIELIRSVSKLAQDKDLTVKVPVSEDITGAISDSLNLLAKETAKILTEVKTTSNQVADVSSVVKQQSDHVIEVANTERQEVEATTSMLHDSVKAMNNIAADAHKANQQADKTMSDTEQAMDNVLRSVDGINSIRSTISETEKRIKRLGERSQEITGIVNLINSIAERTHILALNASMHAASAGEAGRGFAVVADEVQRLAENARQATSEITTVVNNIRIETTDTVTTMNKVISQVAEGTRLAEMAGQSMKQTQEATSQLVHSVQAISQSSNKQADVSHQLLERAKQIHLSTEKTGKELLEQTRQTDTLVQYSENLLSAVGIFHLPVDEQLELVAAKSFEVEEIKQAV